MEYRIEHDSMGEIKVPSDKLWGAQTQRSSENFLIGVGIETMPKEIISAFGILKKAAAIANRALRPDKMSEEKCARFFGILQSCKGIFLTETVYKLCFYTCFLENLTKSVFLFGFAVFGMSLGKAYVPAFAFY